MTDDLQGLIYPVTLTNRNQTWEQAYRAALTKCIDAYEAKHGAKPTHISLPSTIEREVLGLNGLQVRRQPIGRGSLALWGKAT